MPDLRNYDFYRDLRWPDGTLVLTAVQADETNEPMLAINDQYSAIEIEDDGQPYIQIALLDPRHFQCLDLESFDGAAFNGKQYEFKEKRRVAQEPVRIELKGFVVGTATLPEVEDV